MPIEMEGKARQSEIQEHSNQEERQIIGNVIHSNEMFTPSMQTQ
jgi:hypothetical protein